MEASRRRRPSRTAREAGREAATGRRCNKVNVELKVPEMKILSEREAFVLLDDGPNGLPLVQQIAQTLLEADLTIRSMNAVLNYVWYVIADTGKVGPANSQV